MTTNFTHILNANLDMFDTAPCYGISEEIEREKAYEAEQDELLFWEEDDYNWETLRKLENAMKEIMERCGVYGAEEWAEVASIYSDVYKDIFGMRPYGIGLMYHGISA